MQRNLHKEKRLHQCPIPIVAITGGIACGKSMAANFFRARDFLVIDADLLIKSIYREKETLKFIEKNFPEVVSKGGEGGVISFKKLREQAFLHVSAREKLEEFLYARMPAAFLREVFSSIAKAKAQNFFFYDVPLLFEKKLEQKVDFIISVSAKRETQVKRLRERDQISPELAERMIDSQIKVEEKNWGADFVIDSDSESKESLESQCERILELLTIQFA